VAIKTIDLNLVGRARDGAERGETQRRQPTHDCTPAHIDAAAVEAILKMPDADPFPQALDDLEPDVPPMTTTWLQDREDEGDMSAAEAAQPRDMKGDVAGQRGELTPVGAVTAEGAGLPVAAAGAAPRRERLSKSLSHPTIQQPLDASLKALAGDRSHRPQDSSDLLQLSPRVRERTSLR
jgi:hypothetical protein